MFSRISSVMIGLCEVFYESYEFLFDSDEVVCMYVLSGFEVPHMVISPIRCGYAC